MALDPADLVDGSAEPDLPAGETPPEGTTLLITYPVVTPGVIPPTYKLDLKRFYGLLVPAPAAGSLPVVSLALSAASAQAGDVLTLTATATSATSTIAKVEFYENGERIGQALAQPFQWAYTAQVSGRRTFVAKATDAAGGVTTSPVQTLDVRAAVGAEIQVDLAPVNGATLGQTLNLLATASVSVGAIAKVEFFDGATRVGESTTTPYATSYVPGSLGTHYLTAKATTVTGLSAVSAQQPVVIASIFGTRNEKPTVSLSLSANAITLGDSVNLTALAADTDGEITKVEFFDGATKLTTVTSSPYAATYTPTTTGNHSLSAKATDNSGESTIATLVLSVSGGTTPPPSFSNELNPGETYESLRWSDQSLAGSKFLYNTGTGIIDPAGDPFPLNCYVYVGGVFVGLLEGTTASSGKSVGVSYGGSTYTFTLIDGDVNK